MSWMDSARSGLFNALGFGKIGQANIIVGWTLWCFTSYIITFMVANRFLVVGIPKHWVSSCFGGWCPSYCWFTVFGTYFAARNQIPFVLFETWNSPIGWSTSCWLHNAKLCINLSVSGVFSFSLHCRALDCSIGALILEISTHQGQFKQKVELYLDLSFIMEKCTAAIHLFNYITAIY